MFTHICIWRIHALTELVDRVFIAVYGGQRFDDSLDYVRSTRSQRQHPQPHTSQAPSSGIMLISRVPEDTDVITLDDLAVETRPVPVGLAARWDAKFEGVHRRDVDVADDVATTFDGSGRAYGTSCVSRGRMHWFVCCGNSVPDKDMRPPGRSHRSDSHPATAPIL